MRGKSKQSDTSIVVMKRANKEGELSAESVERRDGAKGNSAHQSTDRTQSRITVTQAGVGYGGRRDLPSLPEIGAVCLNGHARICAGGAGQPVSLPRLLVADRGAGGTESPLYTFRPLHYPAAESNRDTEEQAARKPLGPVGDKKVAPPAGAKKAAWPGGRLEIAPPSGRQESCPS